MENSIYQRKQGARLCFYFVLSMLAVACLSCEKNGESLLKDVAGQFANYPSSSTGKANALFLGAEALTENTTFPPGLPVLLEKAEDDSVEVIGHIDTTLITLYNTHQKTQFPTFSSNAFVIGNGGRITIAPHLLQSQDSLQIFLKEANGLQHNTVYLVPIRIAVVSPIGTLKSSILFLKVHLNITQLTGKMDLFATPRSGTFSVLSNSWSNFIAGNINNLRLNGVNDGPATIDFSARLLTAAPRAVYAGIERETSDSLLTWYSQQRLTASPLKHLPEEALQIIQREVSFSPSKIVSSENFSIAINYDLLTPSDTLYLLMLKIKSPEDGRLIMPETRQNGHIAFIQVDMREVITGNVAISNDGLSGKKIDRMHWQLTASATDPAFPSANVLDGSGSTYWRGARPGPQDLILDMGAIHTVKGFFMTPQYAVLHEAFINMRIYSSDDGQQWHYEGMYRGTGTNWQSSVEKPDIKTVRFLNPVTTRYIKFSFVNNAYNNPAIAEINGIE